MGAALRRADPEILVSFRGVALSFGGVSILSGLDFELRAGKGNLEDKRGIGSVCHNLGVANGVLNLVAMRIAQAHFGKRTLPGDEARWRGLNISSSTRPAADLRQRDDIKALDLGEARLA